ncbi:hypothetical protein ACN26Y_18770 [Micromonospora sp. WMMD558]|uniref:hypothetical protein n=1 Tax=Micromonospora sp. WMMD558 TaxID=3403462 RepID=UPI003BF616A9
MEEAAWIGSLAATGAGALVGAAASDAWQTARDGVVALFRRSGPRRAALVAAQLDTDAAMLEQTDPADRDQLRRQLLPAWRTRLADLLAEHADEVGADSAVAAELRTVTAAVLAELSAPQQTWVQRVHASAPGAIAQGVQGGGNIVNHYGEAAPTPASTDPAGR